MHPVAHWVLHEALAARYRDRQERNSEVVHLG